MMKLRIYSLLLYSKVRKLRIYEGYKKSILLAIISAFLRLILLAHPAACLLILAVASAEVTLLATTHAGAGSSSLDARDLVYLEQMGLGGLLCCRLPLLFELGLHRHNRVVLVVVALILVGDGREGRRCLVRHCSCLNGASAPLLEVDLLGFTPEESVDVCLNLVAQDGLSHLVVGAYSDVIV
jgi:hypothetical protein